jgi:small subunit ribosomal protein S19
MDMAQFSALLTSRQRRALGRMSIDYRHLIEKAEKVRKSGAEKVIKTHIREAVILPQWVGLRFGVYSGKEFKEIQVSEEMLGHRLGEYSFTTKRVVHSAPGIRATRGSKFLAVK